MDKKNDKFVNISGETIHAGTGLYFDGDYVYEYSSGRLIGIRARSIRSRARVMLYRLRLRARQLNANKHGASHD